MHTCLHHLVHATQSRPMASDKRLSKDFEWRLEDGVVLASRHEDASLTISAVGSSSDAALIVRKLLHSNMSRCTGCMVSRLLREDTGPLRAAVKGQKGDTVVRPGPAVLRSNLCTDLSVARLVIYFAASVSQGNTDKSMLPVTGAGRQA